MYVAANHDQEIEQITSQYEEENLQINPFNTIRMNNVANTKRYKSYLEDDFVDVAGNSLPMSPDGVFGDPLERLKKGMLMSTYRNSPVETAALSGAMGSRVQISGPDQSFLKKVGQYAGA